MIKIQKSQTADTRTCDFASVTKETLLASSKQHIGDVRQALNFFIARVCEAGQRHDPDKLTDIDGFYADFVTGFKQTGWWDRHRKLNRHHLAQEDGIPADVNLIDVLDCIADCVMAGMARSGSVYPLSLRPELLERAFQNTVEMLKAQVIVESDDRTLNEEDLAGFGRRIADGARSSLEAADVSWRYLPSFRDAVAAEATAILKTVVLHEREQAKAAQEPA